MRDLNQVRMVTANFSVLQGLKMVPLGLLLLVVTLWANAQTGPARNFLLPGGCIPAAFLLYWIIARYYDRTYGTVQAMPAQRRSEWLRGALGGALGLAAFLLDVYARPAVSLIGLMMAGVILGELVRLGWNSKPLPILLYPFIGGVLLLAGLSLLPAAGLDWWHPLGIKTKMLGVTATAGVLFMLFGVLGHMALNTYLGLGGSHEQRV
jgi:hypothetical protein